MQMKQTESQDIQNITTNRRRDAKKEGRRVFETAEMRMLWRINSVTQKNEEMTDKSGRDFGLEKVTGWMNKIRRNGHEDGNER